jgi:phage tail sheath protein FI
MKLDENSNKIKKNYTITSLYFDSPNNDAFNDKVAEPWYAPAGLNRGGITSGIRAERKLQQANRDSLYDKNVNPIASFPQVGLAAWGQKTLQKKASALDRINVRRLLIAAKKYVSEKSKYFLFENNTAQTRSNLLNTLNPWFERCQQKQGLYKFSIILDESLNTPEVIDRNELKAQIYLQPAKSAEFILVDFVVTATGADFPE